MCDGAATCQREPVVLVDVVFPADAWVDPSTDDASRPVPVGTQRLGFCVSHAYERDLTDVLTTARAVRGHKAKGRFPDGHALADHWSWTAD